MTPSNQSTLLGQRLRSETADAHLALEAGLGFDIHQPNFAIACRMLEDFFRVLQVFEPVMMALLPSRLADRAKLDLLTANLIALGRQPANLLPVEDIWVPRDSGEAMGALYVMEGSTLGGKVISKALRRLPDWPLTSQNYFDPYQGETSAMWTAFQDELNQLPADRDEAVIRGANQTFAMLESVMGRETAS